MSRLDTNRSGEMEVFIRVVERDGFSAAARDFNMTPSAISKLVGRLEDRLRVRLFNRSTRKLQLTPEGQRFYQRAVSVIADLDDAEQEAAVALCPRGHLRISINMPVGLHRLLPLVPAFRRAYPQITLDVTVSEKMVDLYEERADIAIRSGPLQSSGLIARKLGVCRMAIAASPDYLARYGTPQTVADLRDHVLIGYNFVRAKAEWPFKVDGEIVTVLPGGTIDVGDAESARHLAIAGGGIVRLGKFHIEQDVKAGRLIEILDAYYPGNGRGGVEINAVYIGGGGHLPARVRAFLDFCGENLHLK
ncbi:LysR family transcriptional regulator [Thalassospira sp. MCCC 1A01428]|uniref:LysR family transcriptional regulator n=1 Tax=Thalassospira sp. MCCC 1A01428 TaxID=1470575 RepID=UPI000A1EC1F1|nr:LysR family transcriptional regulator [Thalassospira sp. MCCC 1A01428]OSQ44744.1 LysR family transcriptional regulator [Thalassospira sp. MCCC 1A01428]